MTLAQVLQWNLALFLLIFSRWAGMIMLAPVFGARGVPAMVRMVLTLCISLIIYPVIANSQTVIPETLLPYLGLLLKETLFGLVIGFVIYALTAILEGAGQLIDFQMGFIMGNTLDPVYGMQSAMMGSFQMILATMLLLAANAHHVLIAAMVKSYTFVPIAVGAFSPRPDLFLKLIGNIFSLSVQIALPVFGALLLADVGVGLLTRAVPQLNVFTVMFPVKIIFGFVLLALAMTLFAEAVNSLFNINLNWLNELYRGWRQ